MKYIFFLILILSNVIFPENIFFSEYGEGSAYNKYLEIYNGSDSEIDLSFYSLSKCANGCDNENQFDNPDHITFAQGTIVAADDVYVVCNESANDAIITECDQTFNNLIFNGDDFIALTVAGATPETYTILDKIGNFGPDPGSGWDVSGVEDATRDHTLVRKVSISSGNTDWESSSGINPDNSEWVVYPRNSWQFIGSRNNMIDMNYIYVSLEGTDDIECGAIETPCNTIQYAIDNRVSYFSTIILNNGIYNENLNIQDVNVRLASNFIFTSDSNDVNTTILKGETSGYIITGGNANTSSTGLLSIKGLTIEGGYNSFQIEDGIALFSSQSLSISNSVIKNCIEYNGLGLALRTGDVENILIENVDFINNHDEFNTDGVVFISNSINVTIKNTNWRNNSSVTGSALRYDAQFIEIDSCTFINNISSFGAAIYSNSNSIGSIKNSVFKNNSGILCLQSYENSESEPYAYTYSLDKNTIINNETSISFVNYSDPPSGGQQVPEITVTNSLFWDNTIDVEIPDNYPWSDIFIGSIDISNSLIDTTSEWHYYNSGSNNLYLDPLFCDEEGGDFTLAENSPLIGAGSDGGTIGYFDVGCSGVYNGPNWYVSNAGSNGNGDGSEQNPFNTIQFGLDRMQNNDTLIIYEGDYYEQAYVTNKDVVIMSFSSDEVTIYGSLEFINSYSHVNGLNFENVGDVSALIYNTGSFEPLVTIKNCNISSYIIGIELYGGGNYLMENVAISNSEKGLKLMGSLFLTAKNVTFLDNEYSNVSFELGAQGDFTNSILWKSEGDFIHGNIHIEDTEADPDSIATITYSNIYGGWNGEGNIDLNPQFCIPLENDLTLAETSPCVGTGVDGSNMGAFDIGCLFPDMALINDNFEVFASTGFLNVLNNDLVVYDIIDSLEIISDSDEINFTTNEDLDIEYETSDGFYGTENFIYVVHYNGESDSAEATLEVFLETQLISISTEGQIYGGLAMLDETSLYAVSSNDAVYRYNDDLLQYYSLQVGGEINSASTITNDHKVYIASSDNNLYSFNSSGVSNPNWPRPMGSELTASVTLDSDGNLYLGTNNGIFQAVTENNENIWSYNCGSPIYSSALITQNNRLIICTYDGRIICFNLNTINYETPSFEWLLPTGSPIKASPAVDNMGFIYVTTMDGKLLKINDQGSSSEIDWQVNTQQEIEASPILDGDGNIIIVSTDGEINKISPDGVIIWTNINENYQIIGTPAFDDNNNLFVALISTGSSDSTGTDSTGTDSTFRRNIFTNIRGYDADGIIFTKTNVPGAIESSLLINQGDIYFGNIDGVVFKKSYPISSEARNELPMWGTFQGNNQRTGNQSTNQLNLSSTPLLPNDFILHQNYPNPFNPTTQIKYGLPKDSYVNISIYDLMGRKIKSLFNNKQTSGYHSLEWNATNDIGEGVSAGMYIYTIQAGEYRATKKMVLLK